MSQIKRAENKLRKLWIGASWIGLASAFGGGFYAPEGSKVREFLIFGGLALMVLGILVGWVHAFFEKEIENREEEKNL